MSRWRLDCQQEIARIVAALPVDADWKARKKALWGKGWNAHQGTSWGRRIWGQEVRRHLASHGMPGQARRPVSPSMFDRIGDAEAKGEITFPFREAGQ